MKYIVNHISSGQEELILNYLERNEEVERILAFMRQEGVRLFGWKEKEQVVISPGNLLYIESVDGRTYAYAITTIRNIL